MSSLTILKARKLLGKLAEGTSDEELAKEIEMAELFKTIFFSQLKSSKKSEVIFNKNG